MFYSALRYALKQPAQVFEIYKGFAHSHPKQMNTWLLFSSMGIVLLGARGAEKLICVDVEKVGDSVGKQWKTSSTSSLCIKWAKYLITQTVTHTHVGWEMHKWNYFCI